MVFVDFWQLGPVRQTPLFANPCTQADHRVSRIQQMFWTKELDGMSHMVELTVAKRQDAQAWFFKFIQECRNGNQTEEMYNFIHGFPTEKTGSWMPTDAERRGYKLLCENEDCYELCEAIWPKQRTRGKPWKPLK